MMTIDEVRDQGRRLAAGYAAVGVDARNAIGILMAALAEVVRREPRVDELKPAVPGAFVALELEDDKIFAVGGLSLRSTVTLCKALEDRLKGRLEPPPVPRATGPGADRASH